MSDRELRKTTRDASERLKQRQEAKQLLKEIKIRRTAYSEAITEAENQIGELQEAADTSLNKTLDWDFENSDSEDDEEMRARQFSVKTLLFFAPWSLCNLSLPFIY